jgi:hypothetical protein
MVFLLMDESTNKPAGEPPTPEVAELLRLLEVQAAARRQRRVAAPSRLGAGSFRYGSLIIIVCFAFGSLGLLEWLLSQMPRPAHPPGTAAPAVLSTPGGKGSVVSGTGR